MIWETRQTRNERRQAGKLEGEQEALWLDENGVPIEPLKYQKLGKHHLLVEIFGDADKGDNCAGWCLAKLAVAGIGDGTGTPKPKIASGSQKVLFSEVGK